MVRRLMVVSVAAAALLLGLSASAQAAITVANQNDSGPGSLREAIANASPGGLVSVPAGTYTLTGEALHVGKSLSIVGASTASTVIRGNGTQGVFYILGPGDVSLSDMTIRDGSLAGNGSGAGISSVNADLDLDRVAVVHNKIDADGASGSAGGSASGAGVFFVGPSLEVSNSSIDENVASAVGGEGKNGGSVSGAGLFAVINTGRMKIAQTGFDGNTADVRGGQGASSSAQHGGTISGVGFFVVENSASASRIEDSSFTANVADVSGGPGGENGSIDGGGLFDVNNTAPSLFGDLTIADNVIRGTGAGGSGSGGGLFVVANQTVSAFNLTIASNRFDGAIAAVGVGGNAYLINNTLVKDSIVAGGVGKPTYGNCLVSGAKSLGYNIDSTEECGFTAPTDKQNTDPQLGPVQNNGGPTPTMLPAGGSPAVDQGTALSPADQRGVGRPIDFPSIANAAGGDGSDIGAVELQPVSALTLAKPRLNKKKGTATVTATIPAPSAGTIALTGRGLKPQAASLTGQGSVTFKLLPGKGLAKKLRRKGKAKVGYEVVYSPTGNAATTKAASVKFVKAKKKKKASGGHGK